MANPASLTASFIHDKIKNYLASRALQLVKENMAHGSASLDHIEPAIRDIALDVHRYHARLTAATEAMESSRKTSFEYLTTCNKLVAANEDRKVVDLIASINDLCERSLALEEGANRRIRSQKIRFRKQLNDDRERMDFMESHGEGPQRLSIMQRRVRSAMNQLDAYRQQEYVTDARGNALQNICAEMIALLTDVRETLRNNNAGFVYFARDCMDWDRKQREAGIYR